MTDRPDDLAGDELFLANRAVVANPACPDCRVRRARAFLAMGDKASALSEVECALKLSPDHAEADELLSSVLSVASCGTN